MELKPGIGSTFSHTMDKTLPVEKISDNLSWARIPFLKSGAMCGCLDLYSSFSSCVKAYFLPNASKQAFPKSIITALICSFGSDSRTILSSFKSLCIIVLLRI